MDARLDVFKESLKAEVTADIADINAKVSSMSTQSTYISSEEDISRNIVIRNLPYSNNERIDSKVNQLIRDGLKLGHVSVASAERKIAQEGNSRPGVVIATLKSNADKKKVMTSKRELRNHKSYSSVYINHDQHKSERIMADNFRAILSALKKGDTNLSVQGSRVVRNEPRDIYRSEHVQQRDFTHGHTQDQSRDWARGGT